MTVRIATPEDRDGMIRLLRLMYEENGVASLSEAKMLGALDQGLARHRAVIGVISDNGIIKASIGLVLHQWWYSDEWHLEDLWNFVHPDHRKSNYASELLGFSKKAADALGVQLLIGILSSERTAAKVRLYERYFGPSRGAGFVYPDPDRRAA